MTRVRVLIFCLTILVMATFGLVASYYARGYRLDPVTLRFVPNGLLVTNSEPNGAQVFINGELKTATNSTVSLGPGIYDLSIRKDRYRDWNKRIAIEKEIVTTMDAFLFPTTPSLSAVTFSGAFNPVISPDRTKIAYGVPRTLDGNNKGGLWVLETINLPLGFNREPRQITDGDLSGEAVWEWSPDSRQVLLTTVNGSFLLNSSEMTTQSKMINIATQKSAILAGWETDRTKKLNSALGRLPDELIDIFIRKATNIEFSPDEEKILYTGAVPAAIREGVVPSLPGASTQKQVRDIKPGKKYVFDIKEDRNFEVANGDEAVYWFPTSRHLILPQKDRVVMMDYDGTNRQEVYSGTYSAPSAYPTASTNRIIILTNLGALDVLPNLYSLSLR